MSVIDAKVLSPKFREEVAEKFCTDKNKFDIYYCLTCGMCTAGCPYSDVHEDMDPRKFVRMVNLGLKDEVLNGKFIWNCTMCGRCTMLCPMGVDVAGMVRTIRGNFGLRSPGFLQDVVESQINTGNQMEVTQEDYLDTLEWIEEELQGELDDPSARMPVDQVGADFLFLWDPREIKYYPLDVQSIGKIMHAAGASWTSSSEFWDATHYGLFNGDDEASRILIKRIADQVKKLKVKYVVVTECGHATHAQMWGRKVWLDEEEGNYPVYSFIQMQADWIRNGTIKVDKTKNPDPVTYHDPCNASRKQGIIEDPRYILEQTVMNFKEMWPNREYNYCCGGGGGLLAMGPEIKEGRLKKGKLKADQITNTGAKVLVTPCHNCWDQLTDIIKEYQLDVKMSHLHHLVSNAVIIDK